MMKKFECWNCHKSFEADDQKWVECPHCHSDNVDYQTTHLKLWYWLVPVILIIAIWGVKNIIDFSGLQAETDTTESVSAHNVQDVGSDSAKISDEKILDEFINELGGELVATIDGEIEKTIDEEGYYNCILGFSNVPTSDYVIVILDHENGKVIQESKDGRFKAIPYSKHNGKYFAQIRTSSGDSLSAKTEIFGYVKVEKVSNQMSKEELQKLINDQDPSLLGTDNKYISPTCRIMFKNTAGELPDELSTVLEYLEFGVWKSITVVDLTYDDTKHISSITLKGNK